MIGWYLLRIDPLLNVAQLDRNSLIPELDGNCEDRKIELE